jgi:RecG-like helicase
VLPPGVTSNKMKEMVKEALRALENVPDWLEPATRDAKGWPTFRDALDRVHNPGEESCPPSIPEDPRSQRVQAVELTGR